MFFLFCLREEKVIFAIRRRTDADAARKSFISCKKKKLINNILSKSKTFITYLVKREYFKRRKDGKRKKKTKLKNADEWPKNLGNAELKNANQLILFGNTELQIAIHQSFVKWENKIC